MTSPARPYAGPWDASTPFGSLRIGPGVAPGAKLYALRVFGCTGSTNAVTEALDWAADPNGDGNFSDHLDVVNMSLGEDYTVPDDPDAVASDNLSLLGTTVVAAAGNGGDLQYIAGSPANGNRVISVAASQDALTVYDALHVDAPAGRRRRQSPARRTPPSTGRTARPVTGLRSPASTRRSTPPTPGARTATTRWRRPTPTAAPRSPVPQPATVAGKIAWLEWTDSDSLRRCGSADRADNAAAAGAIGVVLADDEDNFAGGILGVDTIPTFEIRADRRGDPAARSSTARCSSP